VTVEINDPTGGRIFESLKGMTPYPVRGFKPRTSKVERATMVVGFVESGKCFLKARAVWKDMLLSELSSFGPNAKFSDMTDCLVMCLLASRQHVAARREDDYFEQSMKGFSLFNR
jgi:predicted phage terminase large subunit-like protein